METKSETASLTALPTQIIAVRDGVLLKRGATELLVRGERASSVVTAILEETATRPLPVDAICERFAGVDRAAVRILVEKLVERRILVVTDRARATDGAPPGAEPGESAFEVFCWNFGITERTLQERLQSQRVVIVGVNEISRRLVDSLRACGLAHADVVDVPSMRNLRFFDGGELKRSQWPHATPLNHEAWFESIDATQRLCLVPTSDFGGMVLLRHWNDVCVDSGFHMYPAILQDLVGYVGPLIVPGETPCYECLRSRQNAHLADPEHARAAEGAAFEGQRTIGYHPAMASILADIVAMELVKFSSETLPFIQVGKLIEVNLMRPQIEVHNVLRVPRCRVCSPLRWRSSASPTKSTFVRPDPVKP
jgi:bacteriocin biosynthesis cyclodehydratase domain-containing protein